MSNTIKSLESNCIAISTVRASLTPSRPTPETHQICNQALYPSARVCPCLPVSPLSARLCSFLLVSVCHFLLICSLLASRLTEYCRLMPADTSNMTSTRRRRRRHVGMEVSPRCSTGTSQWGETHSRTGPFRLWLCLLVWCLRLCLAACEDTIYSLVEAARLVQL
jgi:hypothetical protein